MQNKSVMKKIATGVLSAALVFATALPAQGALVPTEGKKKVVKSMAITNLKTDGTIVDVAKNDEVKVTFPANAKDANYVAAAAFGITLEGKGAAKGAVVKCDGKKIENGVDAFAIAQLAAGEAQTNKIQVISKAKTKKGKKLKVPFTVTFEADASWVTVTDFSASISPAAIKVGDTATISYTTTPADATIDVDYLSSDEAIATVDEKGVVTGVAAGDATITVIPDGNLDLAKDVTVKVTEEEPEPPAPEELALDSVEGAQRNLNRGTNVIVAYFSAPVEFEASDVEIRKVSDNKLYTVESVSFASDKKTATLTLTGTSSAGTAAIFLDDNVDYNLIVKIDGKSYEKVFSIPAVADEVVITNVDFGKKQIMIGNTKFTDTDELIADFNDVLGRTATFSFDKNNYIKSFTLIDETVLYGAFKMNDGNIQDVVTEEKYDVVKAADATQSIYATTETSLDGAKLTAAQDNKVDYAKVTLNPNGTVRNIISIEAFTDSMYVKEVSGTDIKNVKGTTQSLKDYNIVKDGLTATIDDIAPGDVVFYNKGSKTAISYSDKVEGKMTVYTDKVEIEKVRYAIDGHLNAGGDVVMATSKNLGDFDGKSVIIFFDFAGSMAEVVPTEEAIESSTVYGVTVKPSTSYMTGSTAMFDIILDEGAGEKKVSVDAGKLTKVVKADGTVIEKGKNGVKGFEVSAKDVNAGTFTVSSTGAVTAAFTQANLVAGKIVKLTQDANGVTTGIALGEEGKADYSIARDGEIRTVDATAGSGNFKAGAKSLTTTTMPQRTAILSSTTPIYLWDADAKKVTKYNYGAITFSFAIPVLAGNASVARLTNTNTVEAIMLDAKACDLKTTNTETIKGVLVDTTFDTSSPKKLKEIQVAYGDEVLTYDEFAQDVLESAIGNDYEDWLPGTIIDLERVKDTTKVNDVADQAGGATANITFGNDAQNKGTYKIDATRTLITDKDAEQTVTITTVEEKANGDIEVKPISWSDYCDLKVKDVNKVQAGLYAGSNYVDVLVVYLVQAAGEEVQGDFEFVSNAGKVIENTDKDIKGDLLASTLTATLKVTCNTVKDYKSVQWYGVAPTETTGTAITTNTANPTTRTLTLANVENAAVGDAANHNVPGVGYYVVIEDSEGTKVTSPVIRLQAPVVTSISERVYGGDPIVLSKDAKITLASTTTATVGYAAGVITITDTESGETNKTITFTTLNQFGVATPAGTDGFYSDKNNAGVEGQVDNTTLNKFAKGNTTWTLGFKDGASAVTTPATAAYKIVVTTAEPVATTIGTTGTPGDKTFTLVANSYTANTDIDTTSVTVGAWDNGDAAYVQDQFGDDMTMSGTITLTSTSIAGTPNTTKTATITFDATGKITKVNFTADLETTETAVFTDGTNDLTIEAA